MEFHDDFGCLDVGLRLRGFFSFFLSLFLFSGWLNNARGAGPRLGLVLKGTGFRMRILTEDPRKLCLYELVVKDCE